MSSADTPPPDPTRRPVAVPPGEAAPPEAAAEDAPPPNPDSLRERFRDPGVRNYLFAGLAALAMIFVVLFAQGSDIVGGLVGIVGAAGLVLRWRGTPPLVLLFLLYAMTFPFGIPDPDMMYNDPRRIEESHFSLFDLFLAFSVVVYVACAYRLIGLTWQAVPFDTAFPGKAEKPLRRPGDLIVPGEIVRILSVTGAVVIAGQVVWLMVTAFVPDVGATFPFKLAPPPQPPSRGTPPGEMNPTVSRLVLLSGLLFFGLLLARLVFGYWRLRTMPSAEAAMLLQDAVWADNHRERVRQEKWRVRGRQRAAARAKANEQRQPGGGKS